MPKIIVGESFTVALISGIEKVWIKREGRSIKILRRTFLSHSAENFRRGILYCCINFEHRKSLDKMGGGVTRFSVASILSHSAENYRRGILYCCINFGYRKSLDKTGGEEYQDFPSKVFCRTVPKIIVGESFTVALISVTEKVWKRGGVSRFSVEKFLSHSSEKFHRGTLYCCVKFR